METFLEILDDSLNLGHMLFDLISVSFQPPCSSLPLSHPPVLRFPLIFQLHVMCCALQNLCSWLSFNFWYFLSPPPFLSTLLIPMNTTGLRLVWFISGSLEFLMVRLHFHFSVSCIGEGNGNPLQCSCLENPGDGGAWCGLPSMGSHRVGHDWSYLAAAAYTMGNTRLDEAQACREKYQ